MKMLKQGAVFSPQAERLAIVPISSILPELGVLARVSDYADLILDRLNAIRQAKESVGEESGRGRLIEEAMLLQLAQWLGLEILEQLGETSEASFSRYEVLQDIYELGRLYFEMGYFVPAERIFSGLLSIDERFTPARLGLGLLKVERGLYQESTPVFRALLQAEVLTMQAKLGLVLAFLGLRELPRAKSLLAEIARELPGYGEVSPELITLATALADSVDMSTD